MPRTALLSLAGLLCAVTPALASYDHVVVVVEENHDYSQVVGNPEMPYFNNTLVNGGLLLTDSHGVEHPSQPNYLDLFAGSNQGVTNDNPVPGSSSTQSLQTPLTTPNLAAQLIHDGHSFGAYSEALPAPGSLTYYSDGTTSYDANPHNNPAYYLYARKHSPWTNWQAASGTATSGNTSNTLPASVNMQLSQFPTDYSTLPTVSFVIPNQCNDMHGVPGVCDYPAASGDANDQTLATNADNFLRNQIGAYAQWALANNSLLVVTWDENDFTAANHVATVFYGAGITPGSTSDQTVNHYNVLHTIEALYGLPAIANARGTQVVQAVVPEPAGVAVLGTGLAGLAGLSKIRRRSRAA